jgi:hypothetical protein
MGIWVRWRVTEGIEVEAPLGRGRTEIGRVGRW